MKKNIILISSLILMVIGWGLFITQYFQIKNKDKYHGKLYHKYAPVFALTDHNGEKVTLSHFRDKVALIAWGYTNCPDVCPLTLSMLKGVMDELGDEADKVQVLFITVDPERDTVERLKSYVPYFHKSFIGMTGSVEQIEKVAKAFGVYSIKHPAVYGRGAEDPWDKYLFTHTNTVYLVDQKGRLFLKYPHYSLDSKAIASDIKKLLRNV